MLTRAKNNELITRSIIQMLVAGETHSRFCLNKKTGFVAI